MLADMLAEKYDVDESLLFPFRRQPLDFDDVAKWEESPGHNELWICLSKFVDNHRRGFQKAVSTLIRRKNGSVTFFLLAGVIDDF